MNNEPENQEPEQISEELKELQKIRKEVAAMRAEAESNAWRARQAAKKTSAPSIMGFPLW